MKLEEGVVIRLTDRSGPFTAKQVPCPAGCGGSANVDDALDEQFHKELLRINGSCEFKKRYYKIAHKIVKKDLDLYSALYELALFNRIADKSDRDGLSGSGGLSSTLQLRCSKCDTPSGVLDVNITVEGFEAPEITSETFKALPRPKREILAKIAGELGLANIDNLEISLDVSWLPNLNEKLADAAEAVEAVPGLPDELRGEFKDFVGEYLAWAEKRAREGWNRYFAAVNTLAQGDVAHEVRR